ncbi:related to tol protein [Fusarium torulosum]|uniref:Related to tol protein n=1 Tax=Fusarium torulosum TaxID=33205 RepID=A0AAE8MJM4_9HYPO|nr:related to tol protein [Fusarium torulosum]
MTSNSSPPNEPATLLVYSLKSPEEARIFGLRGSDIEDIRPAPASEVAVSPDDWGFTSPTTDGFCKFCQLMLHPDAPGLVQHQPNVQRLISSGETCSTCKWLEISVTKGSPSIVSQFQQGDPGLCDENSTTKPLAVELTKHERYTMAVVIVGDLKLYTNRGAPLTIARPSGLGDLGSRRFWIPHYEIDTTRPYERQDIIKTWLDDCSNHETCSTSFSSTRNAKLPTRVLDLTGSPDLPTEPEDISVKLRETQEGELGTYVALSYCWGTDPNLHFKTTRDNLATHQRGIEFFSLPLLHREAILATLYLGMRYLWIDSLCIIQDSREDWQMESAKMGSFYSNAHLTLAATSSESPEKGLLLPYQSALCVKMHGETISVRMETHRTIDGGSEPLNTRGWTLQEAVLASRLVCFGEEQWLWKCPGRYATEDGLIDSRGFNDSGLTQWADIVLQGPGEDGKNYFRYWYQMVVNYSKRNLTYQTDKWNAIAGLTQMFIAQTGYHYLAGVWEEDLAVGLVWEATSKGITREAGSIPSWSWLSVKGAIKGYRYEDSAISIIELQKVEQEWEGVPLASPLKVARLSIKGRVLQATLGKRSVTQQSRHHIVAAPQSHVIFGEAFLDSCLPDDNDMPSVLCLFVLNMAEEAEYFVLLLAPAAQDGKDGDCKEYRRLGIGVVWKKTRSYDDEQQGEEVLEKANLDTVVLV